MKSYYYLLFIMILKTFKILLGSNLLIAHYPLLSSDCLCILFPPSFACLQALRLRGLPIPCLECSGSQEFFFCHHHDQILQETLALQTPTKEGRGLARNPVYPKFKAGHIRNHVVYLFLLQGGGLTLWFFFVLFLFCFLAWSWSTT